VKANWPSGAAPAIFRLVCRTRMRAPASAVASSSSICVRLAKPAIRQKRSKIAPTSPRASSTAAVSSAVLASASEDVIGLFMVFAVHWIRHPEPTAQGEQRRPSLREVQHRPGHSQPRLQLPIALHVGGHDAQPGSRSATSRATYPAIHEGPSTWISVLIKRRPSHTFGSRRSPQVMRQRLPQGERVQVRTGPTRRLGPS
jgi:hypothetical protein